MRPSLARRASFAAVLGCTLALTLAGCSAISDFDYGFSSGSKDGGSEGDGSAGSADDGGGRAGSGGSSPDGGGMAGSSGGATSQPRAVFQVGGGGLVSSRHYRLRVAIGGSQPMGQTQSQHFGVRVGPRAGRE